MFDRRRLRDAEAHGAAFARKAVPALITGGRGMTPPGS